MSIDSLTLAGPILVVISTVLLIVVVVVGPKPLIEYIRLLCKHMWWQDLFGTWRYIAQNKGYVKYIFFFH